MTLTIGIDIGGTKVAGGVVDGDGRIVAKTRRETPGQDPHQIADVIAEVVAELRAEHDVAGVGIGAAGFVDAECARVLFAPNLPGWRDEPLRDEVQQRVELPTVVENDANAAAWAEARFGAGRGMRDLVVLTVGTGIGGGIVLGGEIYRGAFGVGAEMGHMEVVRDGLECGCGQHGCWEQYATGRALGRVARRLAEEQPERGAALREASGAGLHDLTGVEVTTAAQGGDPLAVQAFTEVGDWLGHGMASLASLLDPAVFVVGGGVSEAGDLLIEPAKAAFQARLSGSAYRPIAEIRVAELGNDAGLVGAADLARRTD
jgi:glucokinase